MAFQPQTGARETKQVLNCTLHEQQKQNTQSNSTLKSVINFEFLSDDTKTFFDKWNTYTFNVVGELIDTLTDNELDKNASNIEKVLNSILNEVNYLPDTIKKIFQGFYEKFKNIIIEASRLVKSKTSETFQKIAKLFETALSKIRSIIVSKVMTLIIDGEERVANLIIKIVEKVSGIFNVIRTQVSKLERVILSLVKNINLASRLQSVITTIKNFISAAVDSLSTNGLKLIGGVQKFLLKFAGIIDVFIKAFKTIRSGFDDNTDFSDSGIDSFWYHLAGLIIAILAIIIAIILAKVGFVVAGAVFTVGMVGFAIYEIYEGVDLLALSLGDILKRLWEGINDLYDSIKQKITETIDIMQSVPGKLLQNLSKMAIINLSKELQGYLYELPIPRIR